MVKCFANGFCKGKNKNLNKNVAITNYGILKCRPRDVTQAK